MPPGWYPADVAPPAPKDWRYPKFDPPANGFARAYTFVQFWLITAAALWLLKTHGTLPTAFVFTAVLWIGFSLYVQGAWLEGRRHALAVAALVLAGYLLASVAAVAIAHLVFAPSVASRTLAD